jgi:hypothetical protein
MALHFAPTAEVQLAIYDARGHLVPELLRGQIAAGEHAVGWNNRVVGGHALAGFGR